MRLRRRMAAEQPGGRGDGTLMGKKRGSTALGRKVSGAMGGGIIYISSFTCILKNLGWSWVLRTLSSALRIDHFSEAFIVVWGVSCSTRFPPCLSFGESAWFKCLHGKNTVLLQWRRLRVISLCVHGNDLPVLGEVYEEDLS